MFFFLKKVFPGFFLFLLNLHNKIKDLLRRVTLALPAYHLCTQYLTEMPICIELYIGTCPKFFPITGLYPTLTPIL